MEISDLSVTWGAAAPPDARARAAALVRDVILGGQDGLVNVLGLVLGMAVATSDPRLVVTAGLAALLAESIAMGGVAFTASGAERQLARTAWSELESASRVRAEGRASRMRIRLERDGRPADTIVLVADAIDDEAEAWSGELAAARHALAPARETRPIRAAAVVGLSTAAGSAVPILPFVLLPISVAPLVALLAGAAVLGLAGMERAVLTGGSTRRSAAEMVAIGLVSALAGYLVGQLLRVPGA